MTDKDMRIAELETANRFLVKRNARLREALERIAADDGDTAELAEGFLLQDAEAAGAGA